MPLTCQRQDRGVAKGRTIFVRNGFINSLFLVIGTVQVNLKYILPNKARIFVIYRKLGRSKITP